MFLNRDLSWLKFNERVLHEMADASRAPMARLAYSAIFSSNLDEFFMKRMPLSMERAVSAKIRQAVCTATAQQVVFSQSVLDILSTAGIVFKRRCEWTPSDCEKLERKYLQRIRPIITPLAIDTERTFPFLSSHQLHIGVKLHIGGAIRFAVVELPYLLNRLVKIEKTAEKVSYAFVEDILQAHIAGLFSGCEVEATCVFRITRSAALNLEASDEACLTEAVFQAVKYRKWGRVVRLEIDEAASGWFVDLLTDGLEIDDKVVYRTSGRLDYTFLSSFKMPKSHASLCEVVYRANHVPCKNIFKAIEKDDVFLHHPFDSFQSVLDFLHQAATDPSVVAIKQTLYRVSADSPIVKLLGEAARAGKQVTVVVELLARFDEVQNIKWARELERQGVQVVYGVRGLKTHAKALLVVKKGKKHFKRYVHLSTGNYNDSTACRYTDMGYFTTRKDVVDDIAAFFDYLTGCGAVPELSVVKMAPFHMRSFISDAIRREIEAARRGDKAQIRVKMNALLDEETILKLYEASREGVQIELIIRGICTLIPGKAPYSTHISVRSVVGEFLEHSRLVIFENTGVFLSSADWMPRNLSRRVELLFPVACPRIRDEIRAVFDLYMRDDSKAWTMSSEGDYHRITQSQNEICAQEQLKKTGRDLSNNNRI
ncbi:polyphosphate kinase 1 [Fusibacter sp. JL298sf-3]